MAPLVNYEHFQISDLLSYYFFRRETFLRVLADLSTAEWENVVRRVSKRPDTIYQLARALALHEAEHLEDIAGKLKNQPPSS
jgi:hypothetical protein